MVATSVIRFCIVLGAFYPSQGATAQETPVKKVVTLLKDVAAKIAAEGKQEAAEYDKFACFCKEQADEKQYAMEKSHARMKDLSAEIEKLGDDLALLNGDIQSIGEQVFHLEAYIDLKKFRREHQHRRYLSEAKDMNEAIDACNRAIDALKNSKNEMRGAKLDLVQVTSGLVEVLNRKASSDRACTTIGQDGIGAGKPCKFPFNYKGIRYNTCIGADHDNDWCYVEVDGEGSGLWGKWGNCDDSCPKLSLVEVVQGKALPENTRGAVALLSKLGQGGAPRYEYHSNDIIAMLEDLLATFKSMKADLDIDEHNKKSASDESVLGMSRERSFLLKERTEKTTIAQAKEEQKADSMDQRKDEAEDRDQDMEFTKQLSIECQERAEAFDQRSGVRTKELTALAEATEEMEKGAVPSFEAHNAMVGLQKSSSGKVVPKGSSQKSPVLSNPVTLVQISNVQYRSSNEHEKKGMEEVRSFLSDAAEQKGSSALSAIAARVEVAYRQMLSSTGRAPVDYFVNVRSLIKDLISKLEADAKSEATQKGNCDEGIKKAVGERDSAKAKIEVATAKHTVLTGNKNSLEEDNQELAKQIAELKKSLLETTELTAQELKNLNEDLITCKQGADSVEYAISILEKFYTTAAASSMLLLETNVTNKYHPIGADRDGNRVRDLAPKTNDDTYHGAQAESEGIIGILEVILSDFQRSVKAAKTGIEEAEFMQEEFEKQVATDVKKKKESIDKNKLKLTEVNEDLMDQENAFADANKLLDGALSALEGWHSTCVEGEETFEERKKKREDEIAALNEAINILNEWQN